MPYEPLWCLLCRSVWQIHNYQSHYQTEFNHGAKYSCKLCRDKSIKMTKPCHYAAIKTSGSKIYFLNLFQGSLLLILLCSPKQLDFKGVCPFFRSQFPMTWPDLNVSLSEYRKQKMMPFWLTTQAWIYPGMCRRTGRDGENCKTFSPQCCPGRKQILFDMTNLSHLHRLFQQSCVFQMPVFVDFGSLIQIFCFLCPNFLKQSGICLLFYHLHYLSL